MSNMDMMKKIADDRQDLDDIKLLTSSKVTDQLKVFLIAQARNELSRVIKLTQFLDRLENNFMTQVDDAMMNNQMTLRQYSDCITIITSLLTRSNEIISKVLKDDSLTTILNTTIYTDTANQQIHSTTVVSQLQDAQSRERVRLVLQQILSRTENYNPVDYDDQTTETTEGEEND